MAMDDIKEQLCGKWKLDRSENFDEFLKELGLNVVFRKMAATAKPIVEFTVEDNVVKMISKVSFFNQALDIKLDGEYQQSFEGNEMKCLSRWEDNKLITEATPIDGKGKPQKFQRERVNDELVQSCAVYVLEDKPPKPARTATSDDYDLMFTAVRINMAERGRGRGRI